MKKHGWGRIIHISGRDGFFTVPYRAHVTCKAGMHSLAKAIALEFGEYGVTANTIAPGKVDTIARDEKHYPGYKERWAEAMKTNPLRRVATTEDIAQACLYLACGGEYVTGQLLFLNGGEQMF